MTDFPGFEAGIDRGADGNGRRAGGAHHRDLAVNTLKHTEVSINHVSARCAHSVSECVSEAAPARRMIPPSWPAGHALDAPVLGPRRWAATCLNIEVSTPATARASRESSVVERRPPLEAR